MKVYYNDYADLIIKGHLTTNKKCFIFSTALEELANQLDIELLKGDGLSILLTKALSKKKKTEIKKQVLELIKGAEDSE